MITLPKIQTYRRFLGDQDGWARTTGGHDADWHTIDELRQALALAASGRASRDFARATELRLAECTDGEPAREALRQLAAPTDD